MTNNHGGPTRMTRTATKPAVCLAVILLGFVAGCDTRIEDNRISFRLADLDGNMVTLADERFRDKVVIIDIWGTWCPPCIEEIPYLIALQKKYADQGLEIVAVEFDAFLHGTEEERRTAMKEFVAETGINYLVLLGGDTGDVPKVFSGLKNFKGFPTSIYIGRDGLVKHIEAGFFASDAPRYEALVQMLLETGQ